ncbi:MAG: hypothetical protein KQI78_11565 [Deltaproteobacteria bacterium]|nr:hypothetical protein [Deltaproteobacteria bacterium]
MNDDRHHAAGLIGMTLLIAGLLGISSPALWAQSAQTPPAAAAPAQTEGAPEDNPPATAKEPSTQDRQRAYRRQKDELKEFAPSEEIRVDKAVDFPVDI